MEPTLESIDTKLDQILAVLAATPGTSGKIMAYDRPVITDPSQVVPDEKTVNADGSIWTNAPGFGTGMAIRQFRFGYISPKKTPEIWSFLKSHMTAADFETWEANWRAHPYSVYGPDIREMIARGALNMITFHQIMQPMMEFVQE